MYKSSEQLASLNVHSLYTHMELRRVVLTMLDNGSLSLASGIIADHFKTMPEARIFLNHIKDSLDQDSYIIVLELLECIYNVDKCNALGD